MEKAGQEMLGITLTRDNCVGLVTKNAQKSKTGSGQGCLSSTMHYLGRHRLEGR